MYDENKITVDSWWCVKPLLTVAMLAKQLEAAKAVWPELKNYSIVERGTDET